MTTKTPMMPCPRCAGEGVIELPKCLQQTLKVIRVYLANEATAPKLVSWFPDVTVSALNNRLEDLRALGFVKRVRDGRAWRYTAVRNGGMWA